MSNNDAHIPHVLLFPNPQPGHINPFLDLAELLCLTGLHYVTFVTTTQIRHRLIHHSNVISRFSGYPGFRLVGISDGLGPEDPLRNVKNVIETYRTMYTIVKDGMRRMLASGELGGGGAGGDRPAVSCFIDDGCVEFLVDVAEEFRIPFVAFHTSSAAITWFTFCVPELVRVGKMPFVGDDDDKIYAIEGLEDLLRIKDIQSLTGEVRELFVSALIRHQKAKTIIFNTFEDLEAPFLSDIRTKCPTTYAIGPLHTHLASRTSSNPSDHLACEQMWISSFLLSDVCLVDSAIYHAELPSSSDTEECKDLGSRKLIPQFGGLILELITGQSSEKRSAEVIRWVQESDLGTSMHNMIDPDLGDSYDDEVLRNLLALARLCIKADTSKPSFSISHVLWYLQQKAGLLDDRRR